MILGNLFLAPMLRLLGASKTVLPYAESYLSIMEDIIMDIIDSSKKGKIYGKIKQVVK